MNSHEHHAHVSSYSIRSYVAGFVLSLVCTCISFVLVAWHLSTGHAFPPHALVYPLVITLALAQFVVQLVFFLHLGTKGRPQWNMLALFFALIVIVIVVGGSLWIMANLDANMMPRITGESAPIPFIDNVVTAHMAND